MAHRSVRQPFARILALLALGALVALSPAFAQDDAPPGGEADRPEPADEAADGDDNDATADHSDVEPAPLVIGSSNERPLPFGQIDMEYRYPFVGMGGVRPYTWQLSDASAALPPGLFLDPETGLLGGVPEEEGVYTLTIRLLDAAGSEVEKTFELRIRGDPFTLRELVPSTFDGRVDAEEYAESAPFRFSLGEGAGDCTVYVRQSGGTLTFAFVIEQVFLVRNRIRILLAEQSLRRLFAFEFDPFHACHIPYQQEVQVMGNPFDERPRWQPRRHEGWLGKANTLFADRWHCEIRINLSEVGVMPGTSAGPLLASFEIVGPDEVSTFAPPRDALNAYRNPSNFLTLRSVDNFGRRDETVLITPAQVEREREQLQLIDMMICPVLEDLESLQRQVQNLGRIVERRRMETGDDRLDDATRRHLRELLEQYVAKQREYVAQVDRLLNVDANYYPYLHNIARDFAMQARDPLPGVNADDLWRDALRFARRTLTYNAYFLPSRMIEALALQRLGRYEESLSRYDKLFIEYPDDVSLALEVARLNFMLFRAGQPELERLVRERDTVRAELADVSAALASAERGGADETRLTLLRETVETLQERATEREERAETQRARLNTFANEAIGTLDGIAAHNRDDGRVTLACATLLYNLGRRDDADKYLTMTLIRALSGEQMSLAIELVAFLGHQREFDRMRYKADRLREQYGESASYHFAISQEFKRHHLFDDAMLYASRAVERLPAAAGGESDAQVQLRQAVALELLVALANVEEWERAAAYTQELEQVFGGRGDREARDDPRAQTNAARQIFVQRYRQLVHYPAYAREEAEARAYEAQLLGTSRENPRMTLRLHSDDEAVAGDVVIELYRHDAPELVEHLRRAISDGWYTEDERRGRRGAAVLSLTRHFGVSVGPAGRLPANAPSVPQSTTGRKHFRGAVSLTTATGQAGLTLQIDTATLPWLNDVYPVIGRVVAGMERLDRLYDGRVRVEVLWGEPSDDGNE